MRGKAHNSAVDEYKTGITPACAGKRMYQATLLRLVQDHPRMCGEKSYAVTSNTVRQGSPPHVRGKAIRSVY